MKDSEANAMIREIPYPFYPEMINPNIAQIFGHIRPFFEGEEECIEEIMNLIIRRQPITYIHSLMVSEIVTVITAEAIKELPEQFIGILGINNTADVSKMREEILKFIKTGALLHDIGKCNITDVINRQSRRLTDDELSMIKWHPFLGRKLTDKMPELTKYGDLIEGHHRSYDGKSGYPAQFDIVKSPYRFLIDILSIADSTDAATDILGRNYAKGKDFYSVLSELSAGKGTRYNPDLVTMIEKNRSLQDELYRMTSDGRYDTYYRAYMDIVGE